MAGPSPGQRFLRVVLAPSGHPQALKPHAHSTAPATFPKGGCIQHKKGSYQTGPYSRGDQIRFPETRTSGAWTPESLHSLEASEGPAFQYRELFFTSSPSKQNEREQGRCGWSEQVGQTPAYLLPLPNPAVEPRVLGTWFGNQWPSSAPHFTDRKMESQRKEGGHSKPHSHSGEELRM